MAMRRRVRADARRAPVLHLGMGWFPDEPGGLNRYFRELLEALDAQGEQVRAVVVGPAGDAPANVVAAGIRSQPLPMRVAAVARAARREGTDASVVHAHFALYALVPLLLAPLRAKPLVVHFHGPWADESAAAGGDAPAVRRWIERRVYRRARAVVVLSEAFGRLVVERYGVSAARVHVVPPGVDLRRFSPGDRGAERDAIGIEPGRFVGVVARRLVPRMGIDVLLDAWASRTDDALLLVVGDGAQRASLEARARELGLGERVRFLGRVDDHELVRCYRAADVAVVPSLELEGFGLVALEALACGTPVVGTDVGGLPEMLAQLSPDLVVRAGDAGALARRLGEPLPDRAEARRVAERFEWSETARRLVEIDDEVHDPRLRVVYVDHCAQLAGAEIALQRLLEAMPEVDAHVVLGEHGPLADRLTRAGISFEVMPFSETHVRRSELGAITALRTLPYTLRLARRLRALRPDVVHTNSLKAALYGGAAARLARVPCVWHVRDRIADDYLPARAVRAVHAASRVLPSAVIANSRTTAATLPRVDRTVVVPSPVDFATTCYKGTSAGPLRVGIVGRLAEWKGQHLFLEAFARGAGGTDARAVVVGEALFGEDDYGRGLRALATRLDLDGRVEFTGFADDVRRELARLDVLVHASVLAEPFGLAVVEGMAAGLPVVAADAGGPAEVIRDGVDGLLYPPGDVDALAHALQTLLRDPELRARLGEAARERAREFAPDRVAAQVLDVYRSVVRR